MPLPDRFGAMAAEVEHAGLPQRRPPGERLELHPQPGEPRERQPLLIAERLERVVPDRHAFDAGNVLERLGGGAGPRGEHEPVVAAEPGFDGLGPPRERKRIGDGAGGDVLQVVGRDGVRQVVQIELPQQRWIGLQLGERGDALSARTGDRQAQPRVEQIEFPVAHQRRQPEVR